MGRFKLRPSSTYKTPPPGIQKRWLNEKYNLPCTPDMAAVYLESGAS